MTTAAVAAPRRRPTPADSCDHCGQPVAGPIDGDGPRFCCVGCRIVYETLHDAGLDGYYAVRDRTAAPSLQRRPPPEIAESGFAELATAGFLDEHTVAVGDGGARRVELALDGVHCAACVWLVERLPRAVPGVLSARLDLPRARLSLVWRPDETTLPAVARRLANLGYTAHPIRADGEASGRTAAERSLLVRLAVCWALAGNVMLLSAALYSGLTLARDPLLAAGARWLCLGLTTGSLAIGGSLFFSRAWASIRFSFAARSPALSLDLPISLGLLVGYGNSVWATVSGRGEVWFDSLAVLTAAVLTARWLQLRARRLAGDATDRLLSLVPTVLRKRTADGETMLVGPEGVVPGDTVEVRGGEVVPVDGRVVAGRSHLNRAVLTGESRAEPVGVGDEVTAGATNLTSVLLLRVERAGEATRIGGLLRWVRDHSARTAPIVQLADRLSGPFVAIVLGLAALTAAVFLVVDPAEATGRVVALLVVTCPCALGMATPLAFIVATGQAARRGVFIKGEATLERLTGITTVLLDKTGTLTEGTLAVVGWWGDDDALRLAAAVESRSNHPVARAVAARWPCASSADRVEEVPGSGIVGRVEGHTVAVGRADWVRAAGDGSRWPDALAAELDRAEREAQTAVVVSVDGVPTAAVRLGDRLRPDSAALVAAWRRRGLTVGILSGDDPAVVRSLARQLGLSDGSALGSMSPEAKRDEVARRQSAGEIVLMVGDGVNDAAALQRADVGVAVHGGSAAALVAADVFLTRAGLAPLAQLLDGSGRTMATVRRNLGFSLAYNVLGAAAAMLGWVDPLVAAVAMPVSSMVVVLSSIGQRPFGSEESER